MFDHAQIENGGIVERIQQSEAHFQLAQMYGCAAKKTIVGASAGILDAVLLVLGGCRRRRF